MNDSSAIRLLVHDHARWMRADMVHPARSGGLTGSMDALAWQAALPRCARGRIHGPRRGESRTAESGRVRRASRSAGKTDDGRGGPGRSDRRPSSENWIALTWTISAMGGVSADWPPPHESSRPSTSTGTAIPRTRRVNRVAAHPSHDRSRSPLPSLIVNSRPSGSCSGGPQASAPTAAPGLESSIP